MDYFDQTKKATLDKLYKPDKSSKGEVDIDAIPVIEAINKKKDYYTTSSCSGRISLFYEAKSGRKDESGWLFVKHGTVKFKEVKEYLKNLPEETVWFRQEAPIFHVACRTQENAKKLLELCRDVGLKHSGIIGQSKRYVVEIIFNDKIDVPITERGVLFIDDNFLKFLIEKANFKFKKNQYLLKKFKKTLVQML